VSNSHHSLSLKHALLLPLRDYIAALERFPTWPGVPEIALMGLGLLLSWHIYVPIHELLHAFGCWLGGGTVTTLEIAPQYGATWLQQWFPFIQVGSDYAGRLSGFDTGGSDAVYLLTVFMPFVLTIVLGVPLLRLSHGHRVGHALGIGVALPIAYAGFISLPGDAYEMGSILVSRAVIAWGHSGAPERWRSDDLPLLLQQLFGKGDGTAWDALIIALAFSLGLLIVYAIYWAGAALARLYAGTIPPRRGRNKR